MARSRVPAKRGGVLTFLGCFLFLGCSCEGREGAGVGGRLRGQVPGRVEKGGFKFFRRLFFFWFSPGCSCEGRKEWAQDEGCVGRSRVASKGGAFNFFQGNAAARRPQTGRKRTQNEAFLRPRTMRLNPARKPLARLWQCPRAGLGLPGCWAELAWVLGWVLGWWVGPGWAGNEPHQKTEQTARSGRALAGLGWAPKTRPQSHPLTTGKRSGTAAPNRPKTDPKRSIPAAEKPFPARKPLARLWQCPQAGLGLHGCWAELAWVLGSVLGWWVGPGWAGDGGPKRAAPKTEQTARSGRALAGLG